MNTVNQNLDVRQHVLNVAQKIISRRGYSAVGLNEILAAADVPKGSFYYYFKSKEAFGEALLQNYFEEYLASMDTMFSNSKLNTGDRLISYWQNWLESQETFDCQGKCLAVKLAAEVTDLSEAMRLALKSGTSEIISRLANLIEAGKADGTLSMQHDSLSQAQTLYQMWLGASLMTKITRNMEPMKNAMSATKEILFKE
ncbi:TetR/AcrR family transcriptional regulator [Methylotenera sp.]|uniref:TetR/AcrR family transcriptional regulator n=1 Tax=Methylotenera sp. TaxID=2051956 RepID=UPI0024874C0E|nr:TetR/AcrR family transcriptional regulator [Methylotenera sp.]MDI1298146.1 TetR/AcrR family transcriptional regulator [Methylotenera sp.]